MSLKSYDEVVYPKIVFTVSLVSANAIAPYIEVAIIHNDDEVAKNIGRTETIVGKKNEENFEFNSTFEVIYYVGSDHNQYVLLTILDGDRMRISKGYTITKVKVKLTDIIQQQNSFPIIIGQSDHWGTLFVKSTIARENIKIDFKSNDYSVRFFRAEPPTLESIRKKTPYIHEKNGFYQISLNCPSLYNCSEGKESKTVTLKLCVHNPSTSSLSEQSPKLKCLWKSRNITKHPFILKAVDIPLTHEDLTGSSKQLAPNPEKSKMLLVVQVYLLEMNSTLPILLSYGSLKFSIMLRKGYEKNVVDMIPVYIPEDDNNTSMALAGVSNIFKKELKRVDSFEEELADVTSASTLTKNTSNDHGEERLNKIEKFEKKEEKHSTLENVKKKGKGKDNVNKVLKKGLQNVYGSINIDCKYDFTKVKSLPGDDYYEQKLQMVVKKKQKKWAEKMQDAVEPAIERQIINAQHAMALLELAWHGWTFNSTVVLDLNAACLSNIIETGTKTNVSGHTSKQNAHNDIQTSCSRSSNVLHALSIYYESISSFLSNKTIRVYAGGGVNCPVRGCESYNFMRNIGFPLCQELLLNSMDTMNELMGVGNDLNNSEERGCLQASFGASTAAVDRDDVHYLQLKQRQKRADDVARRYRALQQQIDANGALKEWMTVVDPSSKDWMSPSYVELASYSNARSLAQGFLEASAIYLPRLRPLRQDKTAKSKNKESKDEPVTANNRDSNVHTDDTTSDLSSCTSGDKDADAKKHQSSLLVLRRLAMRKQLCYIGYGDISHDSRKDALGVGMTAKETWAAVDSKLRPLVFSAHKHRSNTVDVHSIEVLLSRSVKNTPTMISQSENTSNLKTEKQSGNKEANLVIWILGNCPNEEDLQKASMLMNFQAHRPIGNSALLIILAAEPRNDLDLRPEDGNHLLESIGNLFDPMLHCYQKAIKTAKQTLREQSAMQNSLKSIEINRLHLIHFVSWSEVMARAYRIDDDDAQQSKELLNEAGLLLEKSTGLRTQGSQKVTEGVGDYDTVTSSIPSIHALSKVLLSFMPSEVVEVVLQPEEEESQQSHAGKDGKIRTLKGDKGLDVEEIASESEESSEDGRGRRRGRGSTANGIAAAVTKSVRYASDFLLNSAKQVSTGTTDLLNTITPQKDPVVSNMSDSKSRDENSNTTPSKKDPTIRSFKQVKDMKKRYDREIELLVAADIKKYMSIVLADVAKVTTSKSDDHVAKVDLETATKTTEAITATTSTTESTTDSNCCLS